MCALARPSYNSDCVSVRRVMSFGNVQGVFKLIKCIYN